MVNRTSPAFHCGERIRADARLMQPEVYRDPGVWSRRDYLLDQGITSTATVNVDRVESAWGGGTQFLPAAFGMATRSECANSGASGGDAAMPHRCD